MGLGLVVPFSPQDRAAQGSLPDPSLKPGRCLSLRLQRPQSRFCASTGVSSAEGAWSLAHVYLLPFKGNPGLDSL